MLDYERSAHGKKGTYTHTDQNRGLCPAPLMIAHDQACYYMIEQSSSLMTTIVPFFLPGVDARPYSQIWLLN